MLSASHPVSSPGSLLGGERVTRAESGPKVAQIIYCLGTRGVRAKPSCLPRVQRGVRRGRGRQRFDEGEELRLPLADWPLLHPADAPIALAGGLPCLLLAL
jgi:hypothetical protein